MFWRLHEVVPGLGLKWLIQFYSPSIFDLVLPEICSGRVEITSLIMFLWCVDVQVICLCSWYLRKLGPQVCQTWLGPENSNCPGWSNSKRRWSFPGAYTSVWLVSQSLIFGEYTYLKIPGHKSILASNSNCLCISQGVFVTYKCRLIWTQTCVFCSPLRGCEVDIFYGHTKQTFRHYQSLSLLAFKEPATLFKQHE